MKEMIAWFLRGLGRRRVPRIATGLSLSLLLVACIRAGAAGPAGPSGTTLEARIDAVAPLGLEEGPYPGISVAVARGDRIVFAKGYGLADISARVSAEADTVYRIGSISKPFLAAAMVRLAEQGRLSLDDSVATLLPDLPIDPRITVRQLLSHTSGLSNLGRMPGYEASQGIGMTKDEVVRWIATQPLEYEPGTEWSYSNSGYLIGGLVLEEVTGSPVRYMTEEILGNAGLDHTTYCLANEGPPDTRGYDVVGGGWDRVLRLGRPRAFVSAPPINMPLLATVGPACSTVTDLVHWLTALREGEVVSEQSYEMMSESIELPNGESAPYGIGLQLREDGGHRSIGHTGLISGFVSLARYFPEADVTIALLANSSPPNPPERLWEELVRAVFVEDPPNTQGGTS